MASITFYGQSVSVNDLSCATVMPAAQGILNSADWQVAACSSDPVSTGTVIEFVSNSAPGVTWQSPVTSASATTSPGVMASACTPDPFDYTVAAQIWAGAFSVTMVLYLVAFKVGTVLRLLR